MRLGIVERFACAEHGSAGVSQQGDFSGAMFAGYPSRWPFAEDYWPLFWKHYVKRREGTQEE